MKKCFFSSFCQEQHFTRHRFLNVFKYIYEHKGHFNISATQSKLNESFILRQFAQNKTSFCLYLYKHKCHGRRLSKRKYHLCSSHISAKSQKGWLHDGQIYLRKRLFVWFVGKIQQNTKTKP